MDGFSTFHSQIAYFFLWKKQFTACSALRLHCSPLQAFFVHPQRPELFLLCTTVRFSNDAVFDWGEPEGSSFSSAAYLCSPGCLPKAEITLLVIPFPVRTELFLCLQRQGVLFCCIHFEWRQWNPNLLLCFDRTGWQSHRLQGKKAQIKQLWVPIPEFFPAQCSVLCGRDILYKEAKIKIPEQAANQTNHFSVSCLFFSSPKDTEAWNKPCKNWFAFPLKPDKNRSES